MIPRYTQLYNLKERLLEFYENANFKTDAEKNFRNYSFTCGVTFVANRTGEVQSVSASISAKTDGERRAYLKKYGFELAKECTQKEITIPEKWNDVYNDYNQIQKNQGFDLTDYKGQKATLYTYTVTNYKGDGEYIVADMLVSGGVLIGGDICNPSAKDGFLIGFKQNT